MSVGHTPEKMVLNMPFKKKIARRKPNGMFAIIVCLQD